jgi:hypothetical protein
MTTEYWLPFIKTTLWAPLIFTALKVPVCLTCLIISPVPLVWEKMEMKENKIIKVAINCFMFISFVWWYDGKGWVFVTKQANIIFYDIDNKESLTKTDEGLIYYDFAEI